MITLEKIDQVVERTGVSYSKAKHALENSNGDVIDAIIFLEQNSNSSNFSKNVNLKKNEVIATLKELIRKGNVTKIIVEKEGKTYLEVPVNIAISAGALSIYIGTILLPVIALLGVGMYIGNFKIKVVKDDGSQVDVNEETQRRILLLKGKIDNKVKEEKTEDDEIIDLTHTVVSDKDDKNHEE
jgi:UBA/TS-N domain protein